MPKFYYLAKINPAKTIEGQIEAETEQEAINKLIRQGVYPLTVKSQVASLKEKGAFRSRRPSAKSTIFFTRQLTSLIDSGINIITSLGIILRQTNNKYSKAKLEDVISGIKDGKSLSDSLASHPDLFPKLYTSMIRTGEASGNLKEILKRLLGFLEKEDEFKSSLKAALTYPLFVFTVSALTIVVLLVFVIPRLVTMFEDMGQSLPLPTLFLINSANFLRNYGGVLLAAAVFLVFLLIRFYKTPYGKLYWDRLKIRLPLAGPVFLKTEISRLCRTLSLLISGGMPISSSLDIALSTLDNQILRSEVKRFQEKIKNGASLSESLKDSPLFTDFIINIVAIGEETGALDKSLLRISDEFDNETERKLKNFTRLLEPVIILVMGLIVGFIVLSMLLPIFQLNLIVK
jgi:type II secretory pathway component PulF